MLFTLHQLVLPYVFKNTFYTKLWTCKKFCDPRSILRQQKKTVRVKQRVITAKPTLYELKE